jgi:hypothetical protein
MRIFLAALLTGNRRVEKESRALLKEELTYELLFNCCCCFGSPVTDFCFQYNSRCCLEKQEKRREWDWTDELRAAAAASGLRRIEREGKSSLRNIPHFLLTTKNSRFWSLGQQRVYPRNSDAWVSERGENDPEIPTLVQLLLASNVGGGCAHIIPDPITSCSSNEIFSNQFQNISIFSSSSAAAAAAATGNTTAAWTWATVTQRRFVGYRFCCRQQKKWELISFINLFSSSSSFLFSSQISISLSVSLLKIVSPPSSLPSYLLVEGVINRPFPLFFLSFFLSPFLSRVRSISYELMNQ